MAIGSSVEQPVDSLPNRCAGGPFVQHDPNVFGVETDFLQHAADQKDIVHATFQARRLIRIIVDADDQRTTPPLFHSFLELFAAPREGALSRRSSEYTINVLPGKSSLHIAGVSGSLGQIRNGIVPGYAIVPRDFFE